MLWGACDALYTPRAARPAGGHRRGDRRRAGRRRARGAAPGAVVGGARARAAARDPRSSCSRTCTGPTRRRSTSCACSPGASSRVPALVLATYRDDELTRAQPLRIALGELAAARVERIRLAPLSPGGRRRAGRAAPRRRRRAAPADRRQPVLRHRGRWPAAAARSPETVRDAVLARAARLDAARARGCSTRSRSCRRGPSCGCSRRWSKASSTALDACLASGMLRAERDARRLPARDRPRAPSRTRCRRDRRVVLHRRALAALDGADGGARPGAPRPPRRGGRRRGRRLRYAPAAGERAAALGAHREAAAQFARALRYADALPPARPGRAARATVVRVLPDGSRRRGDRGATRGAGRPSRGRRPPPRGRHPPVAVTAACGSGGQRGRRDRGGPRDRAAGAARTGARSSRWRTATCRSCGC